MVDGYQPIACSAAVTELAFTVMVPEVALKTTTLTFVPLTLKPPRVIPMGNPIICCTPCMLFILKLPGCRESVIVVPLAFAMLVAADGPIAVAVINFFPSNPTSSFGSAVDIYITLYVPQVAAAAKDVVLGEGESKYPKRACSGRPRQCDPILLKVPIDE